MAVTFLVPILAVPLPFDGVGDLLVVVYLLLLGTFFLALAGLDPGSPFGGMGASREMTVAALAEPTVALAIFALALSAGSTNLGQIVARTMTSPGASLSPGHLLAFGALFIVTLAETGRLPIDNPATHLELTMIHEAMVLEYSGRYLALIEWAAAPEAADLLLAARQSLHPVGRVGGPDAGDPRDRGGQPAGEARGPGGRRSRSSRRASRSSASSGCPSC